jgi:hypothetical protein
MSKNSECSKKMNCCYYHEHNDLVNKICSSCVYRKIKVDKTIEISKSFSQEVDKMILNSLSSLKDRGRTNYTQVLTDNFSQTKNSIVNLSFDKNEYKIGKSKSNWFKKLNGNVVFCTLVVIVIVGVVFYYLIFNLNDRDKNVGMAVTSDNYSNTDNSISNTLTNNSSLADSTTNVVETSVTTSVSATSTDIQTTSTPNQSDNALEKEVVVSYVVNKWNNGSTISISIKNNSPSRLKNWTMKFNFPGDQVIGDIWNADFVQAESLVTITGKDYNSSIRSNGSVDFGFIVSYKKSNAIPSTCQINGVSYNIN